MTCVHSPHRVGELLGVWIPYYGITVVTKVAIPKTYLVGSYYENIQKHNSMLNLDH